MIEPWVAGAAAPPAASDATTTPPGWYPDPSGVGQLRYWDGGAWSPGVVIDGRVTERVMPWPPPPQATGPRDDRADLPGRAVLYAVAGFVVGIVAGLALALAGEAARFPDLVVLVLNLVGLWSGLVGACWLASRQWGSGNLRRDFGFQMRGKDLSWGLLMSIVAKVAGIFVIIPFLFGPEEFLGTNQGVFEEVRDTLPSFLVFAVIAVIGAPLVEELFFRGLLQRSLTPAMGAAGAIAIQAVLFGLSHFSPLLGKANLSVIAVITAAGVVFGITAWWRQIGTSVAAHGYFNLIAVILAAVVSE